VCKREYKTRLNTHIKGWGYGKTEKNEEDFVTGQPTLEETLTDNDGNYVLNLKIQPLWLVM
jgi:hypothetical protein